MRCKKKHRTEDACGSCANWCAEELACDAIAECAHMGGSRCYYVERRTADDGRDSRHRAFTVALVRGLLAVPCDCEGCTWDYGCKTCPSMVSKRAARRWLAAMTKGER